MLGGSVTSGLFLDDAGGPAGVDGSVGRGGA